MPSALARRLPATLLLALALGLVAMQLQLALTPLEPFRAAWLVLLKGTAGAVLLGTLAGVVWATTRGVDLPVPLPTLPLALPGGRRLPGWLVAIGGPAALIAVLLAGQPARLTLTLYCFVLLAAVIWWVVRPRAGAGTATRAVFSLALLSLVAGVADYRSMRFVEDWRPSSPYRWAVGWPTEAWRLRHSLRLDAPAAPRELQMRLFLAAPYSGPARVYATVNGRDVEVQQSANELRVDVPAALVGGATRLDLELRQAPADPRLRLLASHWTQGASLGRVATGYSTGDGRGWLWGTFNDVAGRHQPGVLALHVEGLD